jgi:hypothetical protein
VRSAAIVLALAALATYGQDLHGSVETIGEVRILNLWGTWEEMGYAHGYLLGPDLKEVYEDYFLELAGGIGNIDLLRTYFPLYFEVPDEFRQYAAGIIAGAADTISLYSSVFGREVDTLDLYITASVPDLSALVDGMQLYCSSTSGWGGATSGDPQLQGDPAISRNLDYYVDTQGTILGQNLLVTFDPAAGQDWVSVTFPGFMGSLSGMNETGINATLNMGNHQGTTQTTTPFVPICLALALGLSDTDFDGSGTCDIEDMMAALTEWNRSNSYDIHVTSPAALGTSGEPAVVVEVNNEAGYAFRYSADEPGIAPGRMILTNHHRVLYPPVYCIRYEWLMDSLTTDPDITLDRLWDFMRAVGGPPVPGTGGTLQTMIFQPEQRRMGLAFSSPGTASYDKTPEWIDWADIFPNHVPQSAEGESGATAVMTITPNPATTSICIERDGIIPSELRLFDLSGRELALRVTSAGEDMLQADVTDFPTGIYTVIRTTGGEREAASFLVLR